MIIIFGKKAKTHTLEHGYFFCPECQMRIQASRCRTDWYFHLFFIPIVTVSRGREYFRCTNCSTPFDVDADGAAFDWGDREEGSRWECYGCGHQNPNHTYHCQKCGEHV